MESIFSKSLSWMKPKMCYEIHILISLISAFVVAWPPVAGDSLATSKSKQFTALRISLLRSFEKLVQSRLQSIHSGPTVGTHPGSLNLFICWGGSTPVIQGFYAPTTR